MRLMRLGGKAATCPRNTDEQPVTISLGRTGGLPQGRYDRCVI
jgi:hypothetical protein